MFLVWIGVAMLLAKWLGVGFVAELDWLWVLVPFAGAFIWFEFLEDLLGRGSREQGIVDEQVRAAERRAQSFGGARGGAGSSPRPR